MVSKQLRASGGIWLSAAGENILIDPGPGSLVRCLSSRPPLDPFGLRGVILTHRHLDHSNDVNIIVEAMTNCGKNKKGILYAPLDALEGPDPVVQLYLRSFLDKIEYLEEGKQFHHFNFTLEIPVRHKHPVETYGLKFAFSFGKVAFVTDTSFFSELMDHYSDADILVLNVVLYEDHVADKVYHLNFKQAKDLVKGVMPKVAILTHFGMTMLQRKPYLLAQKLEEELGIRVIAAKDGMKLDLPELVHSSNNK